MQIVVLNITLHSRYDFLCNKVQCTITSFKVHPFLGLTVIQFTQLLGFFEIRFARHYETD